jgi:hypothetical protein
VIEFVEECRREWRRLGVPDPIANEMAADLTSDIEEAEGEGGSAEDVLGNSIFDAQRFAASWANARGVTAPVPLHDGGPPRRRAFPVVALSAFAGFFALAAIALLIGRRSASAAISVRRILTGPGPIRSFRPGSVTPPFRAFVSGPQFPGGNWAFVVVAALLLVACIVALGLAFLYWSPWPRRGLQALDWAPGRAKWSKRASR